MKLLMLAPLILFIHSTAFNPSALGDSTVSDASVSFPLGPLGPLGSPDSSGRLAPGKFDLYVFAMSYENDFCDSHPTKKECQNGAGHVGMALHGLWPSLHDDPRYTYQYCSISQATFGNNWCAPEFDVSPQMGAGELQSLIEVMPGALSCLYDHEWYAHGSCSGLTVSDFFARTIALSERFQALAHFRTFLQAAVGKIVTRDQIIGTLLQDLGPAAANSIVVSCRNASAGFAGQKVSYFSEIDLSLDQARYILFPAPMSFAPSEPYYSGKGAGPTKDMGNCNPDAIVISP